MMNYPKAFEFIALNEPMNAQTALEVGMVNRIAAAADFDAVVKEMALRLAAAPTKTLGLAKKMLQESLNTSLDEVLDMEAEMQEIAGNSQDCAIGLASFAMKQAPVFVGK
jgi:2-(1,2-epoxy-1,2-dihydrophenyl)acetyl-CoA isomerase